MYMQDPDEGSIMSEYLLDEMAKYIGTTVTIYTASGGESGCGFTGVLSMITPCFVRLITCIGPAPRCSLGSPCTGRRRAGGNYSGMGGYGNGPVNNVGSIADIPLDKIAVFVHNAV